VVILRKDAVGRLRLVALPQPVEHAHGILRALATICAQPLSRQSRPAYYNLNANTPTIRLDGRFERPCPGRATSSRRPYADRLPQSGSIPMSEAGSIPMSVKAHVFVSWDFRVRPGEVALR
jgi:hypothetical protein